MFTGFEQKGSDKEKLTGLCGKSLKEVIFRGMLLKLVKTCMEALLTYYFPPLCRQPLIGRHGVFRKGDTKDVMPLF